MPTEWAAAVADDLYELANRLEREYFASVLAQAKAAKIGNDTGGQTALRLDIGLVNRVHEAVRWFRRIEWSDHCVVLAVDE